MKTTPASDQRQQQILNAAIACFIAKGFHATSMRDIAREADVSLGNLYTYFAGKQELIAQVAVLEQEEILPLVSALNALFEPDIATLSAILNHYLSLCRQPEWAVLAAECVAEIARTPALVPVFEDNRLLLLNALAAVIQRGITAKRFSTTLAPVMLAQILIDGIEADALRAVISPSTPTACAILSQATLNSLLGASGHA